jgi:hypothetical protein
MLCVCVCVCVGVCVHGGCFKLALSIACPTIPWTGKGGDLTAFWPGHGVVRAFGDRIIAMYMYVYWGKLNRGVRS